VIAWWFVAAATTGLLAAAALHLMSFVPLPPLAGETPALALLAGAVLLLVAMLARLRRRGAPTRPWLRFRVYDGRALLSLVPERMRWLGFAMILYVVMNFVLSLVVGGGVTATASDGKFYLTAPGAPRREVSREEYEAQRRLTTRIFSGHLLLFYLVPLMYFRFVEPRLAELGRSHVDPGGSAWPTSSPPIA
jgi:hypothetical protein